MALTFVTQETYEKSKKLGVISNLNELITNCKSRPFSEARQLFEMRYPYLYKRVSNYRLVAKVESVKDTEVICILDILKKGDKDSIDFNADHFKYGQEKLEKLLDKNKLESFVESEIKEGEDQSTAGKKVLPGGLFQWLEPFEKIQSTDDLVLESHLWVKKFQSKEYEKFWTYYHELVKRALYSQGEITSVNCNKIFLVKDEQSGRSILFARYLLEDSHTASESVIFLLDLMTPDETRADKYSLSEFEWVIDNDDILTSIDLVAPYAGRSYLSLVLADDDLWYQTETNDAANPALSAEELALLSRVRHAPLGEAVLPIFINGRAGSGKSTMLYHLFSDYLHRKATLGLDGDMLFLTYSDSLLKTARENIRKLLRARADLSIAGGVTKMDEKLPTYDESFRPFLGFIKNHVPDDILTKDFPESKFIDFSRFKRLFGKYTPSNRLSADLCWHVIRSFIKGYSLNAYLTPDDYEDLPQKEKSVSKEIFEQVYRTIWDTYKESEYWDTQDLVRRIIKEGWIYPKYSVVFCDEAQDFTRVELEFILKLLLYQDYDLGWTKYIRLPFAMAGDPFQTLNPTGFRWEAIKASFYDEVVGNLDPYGRGNIEFDYKELAYNYRSQAPIVRLSNLFQLWREALFGTADVYPQKPWRDDEYIIPPRLYILNENISEDAFLIMAENSVIIIPCEPGQEKEYVEQHPILQALSKRSNYPTFQSPMTAKGLEYSRVILYGFGEACPENFFSQTASELHLESEYFLNKLYVAATRAMKSLIIVDTKTGKELLWRHTLGAENIKPFIDKSKNPSKWQSGRVAGVTSGDYYDPQIEQVTQDPLEIARKLEEAGQNNPELLRQAMDFYHRAGEESKARHCEAKSFEAEGKFKQAGEMYGSQGRAEDAERCYWKGNCWKELNVWYLTHEGGVEIHKIIGLLMSSDKPDKKMIDEFLDLIGRFNVDEKQLPVDQLQFQLAIKQVSRFFFSLKDHNSQDELRKFVNIIMTSPSIQHIIGLEDSALLLFRAEEYKIAVTLWEKSRKPDTKDYEFAKGMIAPDKNEKIYWFNLAKKPEMIVDLFETSDKTGFEKDTLQIVADAYQSTGKNDKAFSVQWQIGDYGKALIIFRKLAVRLSEDEVEQLFADKYKMLISSNQIDIAYDWYKEAEKQLNSESRVHYAGLYITKLLQANRWSEASQILKQGKAKKTIKLYGEDSLRIHKQVVEEIALSENILETTGKEKMELATYLKDIIKMGHSQWSAMIPIEVMGASFEKTCTFIDALEFYENLEKEDLSQEQITFIRQRWLKVKNKQLEKIRADLKMNEGIAGERLARNFTSRKKELDEKLMAWKFDAKAIPLLPDYPAVRRNDNENNSSSIQVVWQSPICSMSSGKDLQILANVSEGSIIALPGDAITQKKQNGKVLFYSDKYPLSGEIQPGIGIKIFIDGHLFREYEIVS